MLDCGPLSESLSTHFNPGCNLMRTLVECCTWWMLRTMSSRGLGWWVEARLNVEQIKHWLTEVESPHLYHRSVTTLMLHPPDHSGCNWVDPLGTVVSGYPGFGSHWRVNLSRGSDSSLNVWTISKYCIVLNTLHANAKTTLTASLEAELLKASQILVDCHIAQVS